MIKYKKYNFNLIEVALAMAILAIGIASILVLFPVGVNANKSAIANNNLADIAEYMMGYLRGRMTTIWANTSASDMENYETNNNFRKTLPTVYPTNDKGNAAILGDISTNSDWEKLNAGEDSQGTRLFQLKQDKTGIFLFQQVTKIENGSSVEYVADFSTIIKVWVDEKNNFQYLNLNDNTFKNISVDDENYKLYKYINTLCMEFSWPAEVPYKNRETRVFRFEIFNEFYKVKTP